MLIVCAFHLAAYRVALEDVGTYEPFHDGMAVLYETRDGQRMYGAINANGEVVIEPKYDRLSQFCKGFAAAKFGDEHYIINRIGNVISGPYKDISVDTNNGTFTVEDTQGQKGLFDNGRLVIPLGKHSIKINNYPMIQIRPEGERNYCLDLTNGDSFEFSTCFEIYPRSLYQYSITKDLSYYYGRNGNRLDMSQYQASSKGVDAFYDESNNLYGFKNMKTGQITITPKYDILLFDIWINDAMIASAGVNWYLIDADGQEHDVTNGDKDGFIFPISTGFCVHNYKEGIMYNTIYNNKGKVLIPTFTGSSGYCGDDYDDSGKYGWIQIIKSEQSASGENKNQTFLYNIDKNKTIESEHLPEYSEGMFCYRKKGDKKNITIMDVRTMKTYSLKSEYLIKFNDGIASVYDSDKTLERIIDKSGKTLFTIDGVVSSDGISEGVIGARINYHYCYIYNPLVNNFKYNQTSYTDFALQSWMDDARAAFKDKRYGDAKEYYYRVMVNSTNNVDAIIGYGASIANMGYHDEAIAAYDIALEIDPNNQLALSNKRISEDNKKREIENAERDERRSFTFLDALSSFFSGLAGSQNTNSGYQYVPQTFAPSAGGSGYEGAGGSSGSAHSTCRTCGGSGVCTSCHGKGGEWRDTGYYTGSGAKSWIECPSCRGNKRCYMCHGTGRI